MKLLDLLVEGFASAEPKRMVYISGHLAALESVALNLPPLVDLSRSTKLTLVLEDGMDQLQGEWDAIFMDAAAGAFPPTLRTGGKFYAVDHQTGEAQEKDPWGVVVDMGEGMTAQLMPPLGPV